MELVPYALLSA